MTHDFVVYQMMPNESSHTHNSPHSAQAATTQDEPVESP